MSLVRNCTRAFRIVNASAGTKVRTFSPLCSSSFVRFNSSSVPADAKKEEKVSLTAQIYPANKDSITESDVDEWLSAVQSLKNGKSLAETAPEVYLSQLANPEPFLEEKFEPTEEQMAEVEAYANKRIPLKSDPTVENLVNLVMRHGKKATAQRIVSRALYIIQLKTRKDPVETLKETLDKLGPLITTRVVQTGTAKNKVVPSPLNQRQRNRFAITWILEGCKKKKSPDFSVRLAEEIIAAYEGKSSGYDRKAQMHKLAIQQRAYITL
ncbi:ribosomal protein S7 domain-containing protein [Scheffersomyces xylosifermentans]|uniref:ribosomal protein S7 domain-containing protein n=1 Tax=Scheffersomyces xylosifermentans TaxID=1304137 RepID=UPI00315DBF2A